MAETENKALAKAGCCMHGGSAAAHTTMRGAGETKKLLNRLNRIEGQVRGIRRMVEENVYCVDILTQTAAAASAISAFSRELLASHVQGCVVRDIRDGREESVQELIEVLQKFVK